MAAMTSSGVSYEVRGRCAWLTMNRPEVLNALSKEMFRDLALALAKARKSKKVRVVAITGAGQSFSAGLDIKQVDSFASQTEARNFVYNLVKPFWDRLFDCDKPILAVVNGPAYGAGAEIALTSDIVVASTKSKFAFSGGRVGALCCISGVVGPQLMSGRKLMETATQVLEDLERVSPISNSSFKHIRREMISSGALDVAYRELFRTITSPDFRKGAKAFVAKETPKY